MSLLFDFTATATGSIRALALTQEKTWLIYCKWFKIESSAAVMFIYLFTWQYLYEY